MKRMLPLWIALLAVAIARGAPSDRPEEEHAIRLIVQLTDGSRIIGNPDLDEIALKTPHCAVTISFRVVDLIEVTPGTELLDIRLRNGDRMESVSGLESVAIDTLLGHVRIPLEKIASVETVLTSGLPAALCRSLVLHFPFEEDRGNLVVDCSRKRNNGKAEGTRAEPGRRGLIRRFDRASHVTVPDAETLDVAGGLTILAWIRLDTLDAPGARQRQVIVSKHHGIGGKRAFELVFEDAHDGWAVDRLAFNVSASGNPHRGGMINSDMTLEKDRWYHVAAVCDPNREMKIYVDGADHTGAVVYRTQYPPEGIATNDLDLRVGLGRDTNGHFLGSMDEVMIFDRALSAGEIRQIHELQK